ncbi:hypothetical protein V3O24_06190 [Methylobacter sp. Wu8]|uniref:hypothetical protein n=1 Tax=Methylobacter sp. Wu8 TaxID=3118457 RepID=UPI002F321BA8
MASYDVFIRGIRPESMDDAEQIKQKACQIFKIKEEQLESAWGTGSGLCIRRNVDSEEAKKIQGTLYKAGLICVYKPGAGGPELSLTQGREDVTTRVFTCPHCKFKHTLDKDAPDPTKCSKCFVNINDYLEKLKQQEEKEALKRRLLASQTKEQQDIAEQLKKEAEQRRKQQIEDEVRQELFGDPKQKNMKKMLLIGGSVAAVLIAVEAGYYLFGIKKENPQPVVVDAGASSVGEGGAIVAAAPADGQVSVQNTPDTANSDVGVSSVGEGGALIPAAGATGQTDGQMSLQDTHDKANKVLNAFGMDADKLANNMNKNAAPGAGKPASAASNSGIAPNTVTPTNTGTAAATNTADKISPVTVSLLSDGVNNQEWDLFLDRRVKSLISRNSFNDAYLLGQHVVDTESYINTAALVLDAAQKAGQDKLVTDITAAIEARINALPANQADYLAQAGFYQARISKKNDLLTRADTVLKQIPDATTQLKSALKLAVYNFKAGNVEASNSYFSQADNLLAKLESPDQQVSARAALGRAYHDINDGAGAAKWLTSTENLLGKIKTETLIELIEAYAYIDQLQPTMQQNIPKEQQGAALYRVIQILLKNNAINRALAVNKDIQDAAYKAMSFDLIAGYDPSIAGYSLELAEGQLPTMALAADKAIIASRIAGHYARTDNSTKASELIALAEKELSSLPASSAKDDVLAVIAKNSAQALQFDVANKFADGIQAEAVKTSSKNEINQLAALGGLLTGK